MVRVGDLEPIRHGEDVDRALGSCNVPRYLAFGHRILRLNTTKTENFTDKNHMMNNECIALLLSSKAGYQIILLTKAITSAARKHYAHSNFRMKALPFSSSSSLLN